MIRKLYLLLLCLLALSAAQAQRAPKAVNDVATIYENGTDTIYVLANDSNFNQPDSVCLSTVWGGYAGWPVIQGCSQVVFHPLNPTYVGLDTFYYRSCDQVFTTLCDTGRVIVTILAEAPKAVSDTATLLEGDSVVLSVLANDTNYNPQDSIKIIGIYGETGWVTVLDSTQIKLHPTNPEFYGLYTFYYRSCDTHIPNLCDTGEVVINIIRAPIAYPDSGSLSQPDTAYIFVTGNDSIFNAFDSACVTNIWPLPAGWASIQGCGQIDFDPADFNYAGSDTFYYRSCYTQSPTVCDTGMVVVVVTLPLPQVDFDWDDNIPCEAQVYDLSVITDSVKWTVQYLVGNDTMETINNLTQFLLLANNQDSGLIALVCLTGYNPSGDSTVCYTLNIGCDLNVGIDELASQHLSVYPNPATDRIQIDMAQIDPAEMSGISSIVVYDMVGQQLKTIPISEVSNGISVSGLSIGMYLIGLVDNSLNSKMLGKFEVMR